MRRLARPLVVHVPVALDAVTRLFRHADLWLETRGPFAPMPRFAKLYGVELAAHLNARALDQAFSRTQRRRYFVTVWPTIALLTLATEAALPSSRWNPGGGLFAFLVTGFVWYAVYWRLVILPKHRRALRALLLECGHCPACGHDLGDSREHCPACGEVPAAGIST